MPRLEFDRLRIELLTTRMRELSLRERQAEPEGADELRGDWTSWCSQLWELQAGMEVTDAVRWEIEAGYLAGHESLFPAPAEFVADHRRQLDALAATARSDGHAMDDPLVSSEAVETMTDGYARLANADARLAMGEDDAADAVIRPMLMVAR